MDVEGGVHCSREGNSKIIASEHLKILVSPPPHTRYPPGVGFFIFIIEWFQSLVFLVLAELGRITQFEERWCKFHQPLWINGCHFPHVFFSSLDQLMINNPENEGGIFKLFLLVLHFNSKWFFSSFLHKKTDRQIWKKKKIKPAYNSLMTELKVA